MDSSNSYIGEIRGFAGNFVPRFWSYCAGQLLAISSNTALFSIIGTIYGGDGRSSFALPDLRGRTILGSGVGPGLTPRPIGQRGYSNFTVLSHINLPNHTHDTSSSASGSGTLSGQVKLPGSTEAAASNLSADPKDKFLATTEMYATSATANSYLGATVNDLSVDLSTFHVDVQVQATGGQQMYDSTQPYLPVNYIICVSGLFPSRS